MKRITGLVIAFMACVGVVFASCKAKAAKASNEAEAKAESNMNNASNSKILVAYFSATGTTKAVAETLSKAAKADLYEIEPKEHYSSADLDWQDDNSRSSKENADPSSRPAIVDTKVDISKYEVIFVGFPIWWYRAPNIINTFLESHDFSGKTIILFATSGGSKLGKSAEFLKASCSKTTVIKDGIMMNDNPSESELAVWVKKLGY